MVPNHGKLTQASKMMITAYALLPEDPSSQAHLVVISEDELIDSLEVGGQSVAPDSSQIPSRSEWITHYRVSDLPPDGVHSWEINGWTKLPLRTLPAAMTPSGVKGVVFSDIHIEYGGDAMASPEDMDVIADQNADFCLTVGDLVGAFKEDYDSSNGGWWIYFFSDYFSRLSKDFLVPVLPTPGNHCVGNHRWFGTESVNPSGTYFRVFFPNTSFVTPVGENYGSFLFGDWLQVLVLDTHSATPAATGEWLPGKIGGAPTCIPIHHSPMFPAANRGDSDVALQDLLRSAIFETCATSPEIVVHFCGHVHTRSRSVELGYTEDEPPGSDKLEVNGGWAVPQNGGLVEIGQGYRTNRGARSDWWLSVAENNVQNFQRLDLSLGSLRVRTINSSGETIYDRTWTRPRSRRFQPVRAGGQLVESRASGAADSVYLVAAPGPLG